MKYNKFTMRQYKPILGPLGIRAIAYLIPFILVLSLPNLYGIINPDKFRIDLSKGPSPVSVLLKKIKFYKQNSKFFDVIYFGCSRTYFNINNRALDGYLGTTSYNLGAITNWIPTQYTELKEILPSIPPQTTVVWSIGHHLFDNYGESKVNDVYPIPWQVLPDYFKMGYDWNSLRNNVLFYNFFIKYSPYIPGLLVSYNQKGLYGALEAWLDSELKTLSDPSVSAGGSIDKSKFKNALTYMAFRRKYRAEPDALEVGFESRNNVITNGVVRKVLGNAVFFEFEPEHFRKFQLTNPRVNRVRTGYKFNKKYWNTFVSMLDLLQDKGIRVVINEFSDAAYVYGDPVTRKMYDEFMARVERYVESRGIPYMHIDQSRMRDDMYFDCDHFNSSGINWYTSRFAAVLRSLLKSALPG